MKTKLLLVYLFCFGILIAALVYPVLHEIGHMIAILLLGMEVKEITLLPVPSILCKINSIDPYGLLIIAISGNIFPYLVIVKVRFKSFWFWYMSYLIKGIVLFSMLLTIISISSYPYFYISEDDITNVIIQYPFLSWVIIPYIICSFYLLKQVKQEQLFERCYQYIIYNEMSE